MTIETLNRAKQLEDEKKWCDSVIRHISLNHRMSLRFDTTRDCIESHDSTRCPKWLSDTILYAVQEHRKEVEAAFDEL